MRLDPTTLLLPLLTLTPLATAARPKDAILLSEVRSLTLRTPQKTTSRRVPPIPQLKCLSPAPLCKLADVRTMRCTNQGSSYTSQDIDWSCTASLPSAVKLDRTEVICEGYESADDVYVLRGSCGVEYTVGLTEEGRRRFPELGRNGKGKGMFGGGGGGGEEVDWAGYVFGVVFVAVLGWIVWNACLRAGENRVGGQGQARRRPGGGGGGGGGGGWGPGWGPGGDGGGLDDPPPPYPGTKPTSSTDTAGGWRPGFWSGLAGGAAAGYMAGNRGQQGNNRNYGGRGGGLWGDRDDSGSNWGSGSGWGGRSSSSSSGSSGARHESTGYGSTSRR